MIKKHIQAFFVMWFLAGSVQAAPYNMDAPIDAYTWGESMKTARKSQKEGAEWPQVSANMILIPKEDGKAILLHFWQDKLTGISSADRSSTMTQEKRDTLYKRYLEEFSAKWGSPGEESACPGNQVVCAQVTWLANDRTQVSLYYSTPDSEMPFVGYSYQSRELTPKRHKEITETGITYPLEHLVHTFNNQPEYARKTMKGKRIKAGGVIISLMPLTLKNGPYEIAVALRGGQDTASLNLCQIIEISGVVEGAKAATLQLSDAFVIPSPLARDLAVNRDEKPPKGFFPAEDFYTRLDTAAARIYKNLSLYGFSSPPRLEGKRVIVDYLPKEFPESLIFSLEALHDDTSGDTIAFTMRLKEKDRETLGYLTAIGTGIILGASQPEQPVREMYEKVEDILKKGGKKTVNGWTYQCKKHDDRNFTFSATAPVRKK